MVEKNIVTKNKRAVHDYFIIDTLECGIVLTGTEIKSIRKGAINLKDSFVKVDNSEVFLYNCHISPYEQGNRFNHEEKRTRKLLLNKKEIEKLIGKIKKDGYAIVPLEIYLENGWAKLEIALAKGKKLYDKREDLAKKAQSRDIDRAVKSRSF